MSMDDGYTTIFSEPKKVGRPRKVKEVEGTTTTKTEVTKKEFSCQFYNKDLGGCNVRCPKNRNICCHDCPMLSRCMSTEEIAKEICVQVKEAI